MAVPAAATAHANRAAGSASRISLRIRGVASVPVLAPFPHVAGHVVYAELIRRLSSYGMCRRTRIREIPCHIVNGIAATVLVALALVAASRRIFPLGLGRQAEGLARQFVQFGYEVLTVVP